MKLEDLDEAVAMVDSILHHRVLHDATDEQEAVDLVKAHYHYLKKRNAELRLLAYQAALALSGLRPHMKLQTPEQWDELEVIHNRLAKAGS